MYLTFLSGRLSQASVPPIERNAQMGLLLHDALIIGSGTQLVKFSELTIDMFRMVQNLEWEIDVPIRDPSGDSPQNRSGLGVPSKTPTSRPGNKGLTIQNIYLIAYLFQFLFRVCAFCTWQRKKC